MKDDNFFKEKINKATNEKDIKYIPENRTEENNKLIEEYRAKQSGNKKTKMPAKKIYRYACVAVISVVVVIAITLFAVMFSLNKEDSLPESCSIVNPKQTYGNLVFPNDSYFFEKGNVYKKGDNELYLDVRYVRNDEVIDMIVAFDGQKYPKEKEYESICTEEIVIEGYNVKYKINDGKAYAVFTYNHSTYYVSYTAKNADSILIFLEELVK